MTEAFNDIKNLVKRLLIEDTDGFFHQPVDVVKLKLPMYFEIVKRPMDLGTVKSKLSKMKYSTIQEVAQDIRQIWINCMMFNRHGDQLYFLADSFSKRFEAEYEKIAVRHGVGISSTDQVPTVEQKKSMSAHLLDLSPDDLGSVLLFLERTSPEAIRKNTIDPASDAVDLDVDSITPAAFHKLYSALLALRRQRAHTAKRNRPDDVDNDGVEDII